MHIKTITGVAAGRRFALTLNAPVAVLVGETGRGKTTLLRLAEWGATGALRSDTGVPVTTARSIHERLGAGLGAVSAEVAIETPRGVLQVERAIDATERDGKKSCSSTVAASLGPWRAKGTAAQAELDRMLGRGVVLDALIAGTATESRRALIDACARHAPPWTVDQVGDELRAEIVRVLDARWPDGPDRPSPTAALRAAGSPTVGPTVLDGAMAAAEACHARLKAVTVDLKAAQHAAEQTTEVAAAVAQPTPEELDAMRTEVASLEAQIEQAIAAIRTASDAARQVEDLDRRIADLAHRHAALAEYEARTTRARAALDAATERLLQLEQEPVLVIPDALDQTASRAELHEMEADLERARAQRAQASARHAALQRAVEAIAGHGATCPTCLQVITETHAATLRAEMAAAEQRVRGLDREVESARRDADEVRVGLDGAARQHAAAVTEARADSDRIRAEVALLRAQTAETGPLQDQIRLAIEGERAAIRAGEDLAELRARRAALGTAQPAADLEAALVTARSRRATLVAQLDLATRLDERAAAAERSQDLVDELADARRSLLAAHEAWQGVLARLGRASVAPLIERLGPLLPDGWSVRIDLASMEIWIDRPDVPPATMEQISRGERAIFAAATTAALAALVGGDGWRLVVADHAETLASETSGEDDGYLVALARRMSEAASRGDVDQVLMATARLTSAERASLEAMGVQVVDVQPEMDVDEGEAPSKAKRARRAA